MDSSSRDIKLEQKIDAYLKGRLSAEEVEQLWVELLKKPEYIPLLETEIDVKRIYKTRQQQTPIRYYWKWIASAAAVILLVIAINIFDNPSHKTLQEWAQSQINLSQNLSSAPVTRSATNISPPDSVLNAGFKAAVEGNVEKAMTIYMNILEEYDDPKIRSKAYLNLGILQYNSGDFKMSISNLQNALAIAENDSLLKERSYWYTGNAYIITKQLEQARAAVQQAYVLGNIYKKEASKMLKRLDYELGNIDNDEFEQEIEGRE